MANGKVVPKTIIQDLAPIDEPVELIAAEPSWMSELPTSVVTPDIQQLVAEAFSPFENRRRTFWEWLNGIDLRGRQMAKKLAAARDAKTFIECRQELIATLTEMFDSATTLRRRQLQAFLDELNLKQQIVEKMTLANARIRTLQAEEASRHRKLLELPPAGKSAADERQEAIDEHRHELRARADARRSTIADVRAEVKEIMDSGMDDGEAAYEIREVLQAYGVSEDALSAEAREFLAKVEEGDGEEDSDD